MKKTKNKLLKNLKKLSNENFKAWLLDQNKWKNDFKKSEMSVMYDAVKTFVERYCSDAVSFIFILIFVNHASWGDEKKNQKKKQAKSEDLNYEKFYQSHNRLDAKIKIIKNAFVLMIAISKYNDKKWKNLSSVKKKDVKNFKGLFKRELNYKFVCNEEHSMSKTDVQKFLTEQTCKHKLHKNEKEYDALIIIICGHGDAGNVLVTSEGENISIDTIRSYFDNQKLTSFEDYPKIFFIDICRGNNKSKNIQKRGKEGGDVHNDDGFLILWSTTSGYEVGDLSLFSESIKDTIISKYENTFLYQMLKEVRVNVKGRPDSSTYCVEISDTTDYNIILEKKGLKSVRSDFLQQLDILKSK
ncbi:caspase-8 precursor [Reticulomyxa filosa]|uniref:Caspase-8 n=1 Tax=Reticulomyxa filosa TaxID=46433 RepID=X6LRW7_RETFI|nr:caspase-8 precursor [Reticulomyxa filosa]|eukprot:ETO04643.1 caspase-8 precursor [Reticulomyxa filosa]